MSLRDLVDDERILLKEEPAIDFRRRFPEVIGALTGAGYNMQELSSYNVSIGGYEINDVSGIKLSNKVSGGSYLLVQRNILNPDEKADGYMLFEKEFRPRKL